MRRKQQGPDPATGLACPSTSNVLTTTAAPGLTQASPGAATAAGRGIVVVGVSAAKAHRVTQDWGRGQWAVVVRIVDPRAPAQQLGDPPSTATYALIRGGWLERNEKPFEAPTAPTRSNKRPANQQPGQNQKAQGPRDQGLKDQERSLGGGNSRGERRSRSRRRQGDSCHGKRRGRREED